ncbi:MAG TPA: hypothetical protein VN742_08395, partial [Candidatus Binataceae bacterium]|nr:hypothetical protein [Candidatus Binataceae bacterium]
HGSLRIDGHQGCPFNDFSAEVSAQAHARLLPTKPSPTSRLLTVGGVKPFKGFTNLFSLLNAVAAL